MTFPEYFKGLKILHLALTAGPSAFLILSIGLSLEGTVPVLQDSENDITSLLELLSVAYGGIAVFGSLFIFNKLGKSAASKNSLSLKLVSFRIATLFRLAVIEGAALLGCISYLLTKSNVALVVTVILIAMLARLNPSKKEIEKVLQLSPSDTQKINSDNQEVVSSSDFNSKKY